MSGFWGNLWQVIRDCNLLNLVGGFAILLIGWLIALWAGRRVSGIVRRFSAKHAAGKMEAGPQEEGIAQAKTVAGTITFYTIMVFAVLGCFSVLHLEEAAVPLAEFMTSLVNYIPNILGALLLVIAARLTAGIVRCTVRSTMLKNALHERLAGQLHAGSPEQVADYTARTLYYTVYLFFLPAILNVLRIYGITEPLQAMFDKILVFIPHLVVAAVILLIGLWAARVLRRAVTGLVIITRLEALGEKAGVARIFGNGGLAAMCGVTVYALIAIPVVISALTALQIEPLSQSIAGFLDKILNASGDILGAGVILFAAVLLGGFVSSLTAQLAANFGVNKLAEEMGLKVRGGAENLPSALLGKLAFAVIIVLALLAACDTLQFSSLGKIIRDFTAFGGNVLLSIAVLLIGIWFANFAASLVKGKSSDLLTGAVRLAVLIFTAAVAVGNMDIGGTIVEIAFALILGAVCVAAAIAFGIGGREAAALLLRDWSDKLRK